MLVLLVDSVQNADLSHCLSDGVPAFQEALTHARSVLVSPRSQEEIDQAVVKLHQAWMNLRLKADESLLEV